MVYRKLITALLGGLLAAPTLAAAQSLPSPVVGGETIGTPELVKKACAEGRVTYYTPDAATQAQEIAEVFEKRFPCIKVLVVSAVTGQLLVRLSAEIAAKKVQDDVALLNDPQAIEKFKAEGAIRPWDPPSGADYPASLTQPGWWYPAGGTMEYIAYNTNLVSAADAPKGWRDLLDPKWKGKIAAPDIALGGTGWIQYYFFHQKYGGDFLKKFAAQKPRFYTSYQPLTLSVARGEAAIALTAVSIEAPMRIQEGAPLQPVYPADGIPVAPAWEVLMQNSPHSNAALLYANWTLSKEGQEAQVKVRRIWSLRKGIPPAPGNPPVAKLNFYYVPPATMSKQYNAFEGNASKLLGGP